MYPLTVKIIRDRRSKDAPFVAYNPEIDVASCGPTEEKARENLLEAVGIVLKEVKRKGENAKNHPDSFPHTGKSI